MNDALAILCNGVEAATGIAAGVGHPGSVTARIVLWPWRIVTIRSQANLPPRQGSGGRESTLGLSFLLLSRDGLDTLIRAVKYVDANPVLMVDGAKYVVRGEDLPRELQVAVFSAAGIPLQPAMGYVLEG